MSELRRASRRLTLGALLALVTTSCVTLFDFDRYELPITPGDEGGNRDVPSFDRPDGSPPKAREPIGLLVPREIAIHRGSSALLPITVEPGGDESVGPITIELAGVPLLLTARPLLLGEGAFSGELAIVAHTSLVTGLYEATVTAYFSDGRIPISRPVTITITTTTLDRSFGTEGVARGARVVRSSSNLVVDANGRTHVANAYITDGGAEPDIFLEHDEGDGRFRGHPARRKSHGPPWIALFTGGPMLLGAGNVLTAHEGEQDYWSRTLSGEIRRVAVWKEHAFVATAPNEVMNRAMLIAFDAQGNRVLDFGENGAVVIGDAAEDPGGLVVTDAGVLVCTTRVDKSGVWHEVIVRLYSLTTGKVDEAFGGPTGVALNAEDAHLDCVRLVRDGTIVYGIGTRTRQGDKSRSMLFAILEDGMAHPAGPILSLSPGPQSTAGEAIAVGPAGRIYAAASVLEARRAAIIAQSSPGVPEFAWGEDGRIQIDSSRTSDVTVLPDGRVLLSGLVGEEGAETWFVARFLP